VQRKWRTGLLSVNGYPAGLDPRVHLPEKSHPMDCREQASGSDVALRTAMPDNDKYGSFECLREFSCHPAI
jgi:hypothetical protein